MKSLFVKEAQEIELYSISCRTVIVSVKINDGIVMASDSASAFTNAQVYDHAEKIVHLVGVYRLV